MAIRHCQRRSRSESLRSRPLAPATTGPARDRCCKLAPSLAPAASRITGGPDSDSVRVGASDASGVGPTAPTLRGCRAPLRPAARPRPGAIADLRSFDPARREWADLSGAGGDAPPARAFHGFAAAAGQLYVFGAWDGYSEQPRH